MSLYESILLTAGLLGALLVAFLWVWLRVWPVKRHYNTPDFTNPAHFRVVQLPADGPVRFKKAKLLSRRLAQLEFIAEPEWPVLLRIAPVGQSLRLEQFEQVYERSAFYWQNGVQVKLNQSAGRQALATWADNGFLYALYFPKSQMGLPGGLTELFVTETYTVHS